MKVLGLIPARGGSKGVLNKNIKLLNGKPLINYTIQQALSVRQLIRVVVSSDSQQILDVASAFHAIEIIKRPENLATDTTPMIAVIEHVLSYYKQKGEQFDVVCLLQATSPFRSPNLIESAIDQLEKEKSDSLITVRTVPEKYNPHWLFEKGDNGLELATGEKEIISRRQSLPSAYYRDGKIYLMKVDLIYQGKIIGGKISGYINDNEPDVNIDNMEDWEVAQNLAPSFFNNNNDL
ncbi:MAG: acylneuraminate cytidylyltransferase family protein [Chitinophagaceae bacterium]|nr:acylneuraminate cytidylyltransferase family protein [Chitinophagaceae bacterium]